MKALFFLRHYNDIDHITPVIYKWTSKGHTCDIVLIGNSRIAKTDEEMTVRELDASQLCESLRDEIGISGALIEEFKRSGAIEASFNPPPKPAVVTTPPEPPSRRARLAATE